MCLLFLNFLFKINLLLPNFQPKQFYVLVFHLFECDSDTYSFFLKAGTKKCIIKHLDEK